MADRVKFVGVFKQIFHVFVYLCVPFLFYCLVNFGVHHNECMTQKNFQYLFTFVYLFCFIVLLNLESTIMNIWPKKKLSMTCYPWCILWNGIADEHSLFSRIQFSHALSIHYLWLITHGWASMSCSCAVRKKVMWTESFKQVGVVFSWSQGRD